MLINIRVAIFMSVVIGKYHLLCFTAVLRAQIRIRLSTRNVKALSKEFTQWSRFLVMKFKCYLNNYLT